MSPINIEEIKVVVSGDTKDLDKDLEKVKRQLKDMEKTVKSVEKSMKALSTVFKSLNTSAFAKGIKEASTSLNTATKSANNLNKSLNTSTSNISKANAQAKTLANTLNNIDSVNATVSQGPAQGAGAGLGAGLIGGAIGAGLAMPVQQETEKIKKAMESVKASWSATVAQMKTSARGIGFDGIANELGSLPIAIKTTFAETSGAFNKLKGAVGDVKITFSEFGKTVKNNVKAISPVFKALKTDFDKYVNQVVKARKAHKDLNKDMGATSKVASALSGKIKMVVASFAGFAGIRGIFSAIQADMSAMETDNLFGVSFGSATDEMKDFTKNAITDFGMVQSEAMKVSAGFNFMIANITKNKDIAKEMSKSLLQMTADFGSLFNQSTERSAELIRGALTGEAEGLKQFGIIINETTTKAYAYANGIASYGAELNESQKLLARYGSFMEQAGIANGDFAKTINSPANQLKILKAQLQETRELIGQAFRPITSIVLPILNTLVGALNTAVRGMAMFMSAFFGVEMKVSTSKGMEGGARSIGAIADNAKTGAGAMSRLGDSVDGVAKSTADAVKEFKGLMGFDELNILPSTETGGGAGGAGGSGGGAGDGAGGGFGDIGAPSIEWEKANEQAIEIPKHIQDLADQMKAIASSIFKPFKDAWDAVGPKLMDEIKKAVESTGNIFKAFGDLAKSVWNSGLSTAVQNLAEAFLNVLVIGGRLYNEVLAPMIEAFLQWLDPATNWGTQLLIDAIKGITDGIKELTEYLAGDGFIYVQLFAEALLSIGIAMGIVKTAMAIWSGILLVYNGIQWLTTYGATALGVAMLSINWPIVLIVGAIAGLIFIGIQLWKNWDTVKVKLLQVWEGIKKAFAVGKEMVMTYIQAIINFGLSWIDSFKAVYTNIKNIFTNIISFIKNVFTGNWKGAWENIKNIVSNIFDGIKNVAKAPINAIISAINTMIRGLNKIKLPDWVPVFGGKGINIPQIPKLARGGVVNSGQIYMAGEAGKEAIVPLEHNTAWAKNIGTIVAKELGGNAQGQQNDRPVEVILQIGSSQMGRVVIDSINKLQSQEGRILLNL